MPSVSSAAPEVAGEQEVVVVERVLRHRHAHQQIERLDRRDMVPQPQEDVVGLVALAAAARLQEGLLVGFDAARGHHLARAVSGEIVRPAFVGAAGIQRREFQQAVGRGHRVVDVLVGQGDVLEDGQEAVLALQAPDQVGDRIQAGERMQRAAVMAGRAGRRSGHRQRRGGQHGLRRDAGAQLVQGAVENLAGGRLLDELDQWFDRFGVLDTYVHGRWAPRQCDNAQQAFRWSRLAGSRSAAAGGRATRGTLWFQG